MEYILIPNKDSFGGDVSKQDFKFANDVYPSRISASQLPQPLQQVPAFNTSGYFKSKIHKLYDNSNMGGLYVKNIISEFPILVVNLTRRQDRWESISNHLKSRNINKFERFDAVDGRELTMTDEIKYLFRGNDFNFRRGVIGCGMSHIKIWRKLINDPTNNYYIVLEDDAELVEDFESKLNLMLHYIKQHSCPDIVMLGHCFMNGKPERSNEHPSGFELFDFNNFRGGTYGYIISKAAAWKYIQIVNTHGVQNGIDWFMKLNHQKVNIFITTPHLVHTDYFYNNSVDTDIQNDYTSVSDNCEIEVKHKTWQDSLLINNELRFVRKTYKSEIGNIFINDNQMTLIWDDYGPENTAEHLSIINSTNLEKIKMIQYTNCISRLNKVSKINKYDLHLINLEHRNDRKDLFIKNLNSDIFNVNIFNAIKHKKGNYGCSLSHLYLIYYAKYNNLPYIIVAEDDCMIKVDTDKINRVLEALTSNLDKWEIFNGCPTFWIAIDYPDKFKVTESFDNKFVNVNWGQSTAFMIYNKSSYDKILNYKFKECIDQYISKNFIQTILSEECFSIQVPSFSDIEDNHQNINFEQQYLILNKHKNLTQKNTTQIKNSEHKKSSVKYIGTEPIEKVSFLFQNELISSFLKEEKINELEITNCNDVEYFIIINYPAKSLEYYDPKRTILIHSEKPNESWGKWKNVKTDKFYKFINLN
jgi:glycosyl transferase family 25